LPINEKWISSKEGLISNSLNFVKLSTGKILHFFNPKSKRAEFITFDDTTLFILLLIISSSFLKIGASSIKFPLLIME